MESPARNEFLAQFTQVSVEYIAVPTIKIFHWNYIGAPSRKASGMRFSNQGKTCTKFVYFYLSLMSSLQLETLRLISI